MKRGTTFTMIMAIGLTLTTYRTFAQTAEELLPKAIQLEEVKGDLDNAIKTYQLILNKFPDNREVCAEALLHLAMCYEKLGLDQARQTYRDVISKYSEQTDKVAVARNRISRLDAYTSELIAKAEEHFKQGNELFKRWEYESAIDEYENAVKSGPNTQLALNARYCIGQSLYRAGKYDQALLTFTKLIEENPKGNIAPVAELMVAQVKNAIENKNSPSTTFKQADESTIVDPKTGITYRKIRTFAGPSDVIDIPAFLINISPNSRFLLTGNTVVPMDGSAPFDLINSRSNGFIPTRSVWSPDGKKVAFYSGDALCVIPVSPETGRATGPFKKIKKAPLDHEPLPGWSPDGNTIVYWDELDLWTIGSDGNDLKQITKDKSYEIGPVWSPDAKTIAYGSGDESIVLYNVEKNEFTKLAETGHRSFPVWSPDGKWILDNSSGFHFYNLADKSDFELPLLKGIGSFFSWQADGNKLLFYASSYKSDMFLKVAPSNGGPSFEPIPRLSLIDQTWWRNDSKSIAVQGGNEKGEFVISIIPLSGGRSDIALDKIPGGKLYPWNLSSDFKQITFSNKLDNGTEELYTVPFSTKEAKTTGPPLKFFEKDWKKDTYKFFSADGKKLALIHEGIIWILFTNGDDPVQVTDLKEGVEYVRWTADGNFLLFSTSSGWNLMENPGQKGRITELKDEGKKIQCRHFNIDISPDNTKVAVLTDKQIKIIPMDQTKSVKVLDISNLELKQCYELYWSPDGKSLAFIGNKEMEDKVSFPNGKSLIYNIPVDSGLPVSVAPDDGDEKLFISWSPDSKWIAYSAWNIVKVRPESAIWEAYFNEVKEKLAK